MRPRSGVAFAMACCLALGAHAQVHHDAAPASLEVTLAYSADRTNGLAGGCGCFWMKGGRVEANGSLPHGFGVVAEVAAEYASNINATNENLGLVTYLFGPRYTLRNRSRIKPFAQFLLGGVHGFDGLFPSAAQPVANPDALAFAGGGGLNLEISRRLAIRAVQADYLQTQLPNGATNRQDHLRVGAGIVFRFF